VQNEEAKTADAKSVQELVPRYGIARQLFKASYAIDFYQAVRLLENLLHCEKGPGETSEYSDERIRIRPHSGLVFPPADVRSIEILEGEPTRARVTVNFFGLYGVHSPLPVYFYDSIATEAEYTQPLRDFLDMFNHRLYALYYRSWKKYKPALYYRPGGADTYSQRALCLSGLGTRQATASGAVPPMRLAGLGGQLASRARNPEGLADVIGSFFREVPVSICECVARWVSIQHRERLSRSGTAGMSLGLTSMIGEKVRDISGKFRIVLGPLTLAMYRTLLPRESGARILQYLVRLYAPDYLNYDVELVLKKEEIPRVRLGDRTVQLGLNTWAGLPKALTASRIVTYEA
jgi:type VI secretion system protein ImpH